MDAQKGMGHAPMAPKPRKKKRRKLPNRKQVSDECAATQDRGTELPVRPAELDPIVAEIIEALARTIIRDEDRRANLSLTKESK